MKIYTVLPLSELEAIADDMGITLYDVREDGQRVRGRHAGKFAYKFLLRPVTDKYRLVRSDPYTKSGYRKVWAVSWHGHWDFMVKVFKADPDAFIQTALAKYDGREGFYREAPATGNRNIGSQADPEMYRNACAEAHGLVKV